MSTLSEHVSLTITEDDVGIARATFGVGMLLSYSAAWSERTREYGSLLDVAVDFADTSSPEYIAANAYFEQSPHPNTLVIGRGANKPTMQYQLGASSAVAATIYSTQVDGQGVTSTLASYTSDSTPTLPEINNGLLTALNAVTGKNYTAVFQPLASLTGQTFVVASQAQGELTITTHGLNTGDGPVQVSNSGGALPTGLALATNYYVIKVDANTIQLATSLANALAGTFIVLSSNGTGTQTETPQAGALSPVLGLTVTGSAAGDWFSLAISDATLMSNKMTHADPGIAADLTAILTENDGWYALLTTFNSQALVLAAASWTEAQSLIYLPDVVDTGSINTVGGNGGTDDVLDALHSHAYNRTAGSYHPSPINMFSAGWAGNMLPYDPGSATWKFKTLSGVLPVTLTATQRTNIRARKGNTYQTVAGRNITWEGTIAGGTFGFIDVTQGLDWLEDDMTKGVFGALAGSAKIAYTDAGIAIIRSEVKASLKRAVQMGIIDDNFVVTVPTAASVSAADKAARALRNVSFTATLQGAIHEVFIDGVVAA